MLKTRLGLGLGLIAVLIAAFALPLATASRVDEGGPDRPAQAAEMRLLARKSLNNSLRYLHTTWWNRYYSYETTQLAAGPGQRSGASESVEVLLPRGGFSAGGVSARAQASAMYATAIALHEEGYRGSAVTVSQAEALRRTTAWANGIALSYRNDSWGHGWQSALWVYYLGYGARQIWPSLPTTTQTLVAQTVASEANHLLTVRPSYYRDASGTVVYAGDSKSEEDAWNAALLLLAAREFPSDPNAAAWLRHGRWYAIAAYATPNQVGLDPRVQGSNVETDGTVVNHDRVLPDYMFTKAELVAKAALVSDDTGSSVPTETSNNLRLMWEALTQVKFSPQQFAAPGGTIYRRSSTGSATADIYYPQGTDVSQFRRFNAAQMDVEAFCAQIDPVSYDWAIAHLTYVLLQQSRYEDGHIFSFKSTTNLEDEQFAAATTAEIFARLKGVR